MIRFIDTGFQRSRTTWLYNQSKSFDEIYMPPKKEIHYFDRSEKYLTNSELSFTTLKQRIFIFLKNLKSKI